MSLALSFVAPTRPLGFAPMLAGVSAPIDFSQIDTVASDRAQVFAVAPEAQFNLHPYIEHFDGAFFAMWSAGADDEDEAGQRVRFVTGANPMAFGASAYLTPPPPAGFRWIARGFWTRDGQLLALASLDEANQGYFGDSLALYAFPWTGSGWGPQLLVADDTINNFPPIELDDGSWLMARRDHDWQASFLRGDIGAWTIAPIASPVGVKLNEPTVAELPTGDLVTLFRDNAKGGFLYRAFSEDDGLSWSTPQRTNFPDATSKNTLLRLSDGRFVLLSNPHQSSRIPLVISISDDGQVFDQMAILRGEPTAPLYPTASKVPGYMYADAVEHGGSLYVIYSINKETIEISRIAIDAL